MPISRKDNDLIDVIYDCVINPTNWDQVIRRIADATNSTSGGLYFRHRLEPARLTAQHNMDPRFIDSYVQTYHRLDPLASVAITVAPGEVRTGAVITQTDQYRRSAFFNEWAKPQDWIDVVGVGILHAPDAHGLLSLWKASGATPLERREWQILNDMAPHLQRAFELHVLLSRARERAASIGAAAQRAGFAVVLLTEDCRVLFANGAAEGLIGRREGLRLERGRLAASTQAATSRLQAFARPVSQSAPDGQDRGATLKLDRDDERGPLVAHLIALGAANAAAFLDKERPAVAIFIVDPSSNLVTRVGGIADHFGLTAAEARVLAELIRGAGLREAAAKLGITDATARTHAKRIFAKTGTARQSELIRLFFQMTLPPAF